MAKGKHSLNCTVCTCHRAPGKKLPPRATPRSARVLRVLSLLTTSSLSLVGRGVSSRLAGDVDEPRPQLLAGPPGHKDRVLPFVFGCERWIGTSLLPNGGRKRTLSHTVPAKHTLPNRAVSPFWCLHRQHLVCL